MVTDDPSCSSSAFIEWTVSDCVLTRLNLAAVCCCGLKLCCCGLAGFSFCHSKYELEGQNSVWFTSDISNVLRKCNVAAKVDHFHTESNLNVPSKFWKTIKSLAGDTSDITLPPCVVKGSNKISDKAKRLACL